MEKILTVVVPSYNAASYLEETIPTLLSTEYNNLLDVIIVNDGSKDNTSEVAHQIAEHYPQAVRVIDKENGGHGSAINVGITHAKGKYFKVIDADDWVDGEAFGNLIEYLKITDVDQVISPYNEVYVDSQVINRVSYLSNAPKLITMEYTLFLQKINCVPQMHSLTIKTSILQEQKIQVDEKMFYVDTEYIIYPMPYIKTVSYLNECVYQYRLGTEGQSVNISNYIKNRNMLKNVLFSIIHFLQKNQSKLDSTRIEMIERTLYGMVSLLVNAYLAMEDTVLARQELDVFINEIDKIAIKYWEKCPYRKVSLLRITHMHAFSMLSWYTRKMVYRTNEAIK